MTQLLDVAARVGEQDSVLVEQVFQCLAYLLKYLARYVASDLPVYLTQYSVLLRHPKPWLRHFAGETLAFIIRRLKASKVEAALSDVFGLLAEEGRSMQELANLADSLSVILFEAAKGVQRRFHSQAPSLLRALLKVQVRGSASNLAPAPRAAQLWAGKAALLRMRNHADGIDGAADVIEAMFRHFRTAVRRYARNSSSAAATPGGAAAALRSGSPKESRSRVVDKASDDEDVEEEDEEEEEDEDELDDEVEGALSEDGLRLLEQEVLFYVDLVVNWLYAKPQPKNREGESWQAFAEASLGCFAALIQAGDLPGRSRSVVPLESGSQIPIAFPPTPVPVTEAVRRAAALLWRGLPLVATNLCDTKLTVLLAGPASLAQQQALLQTGSDLALSLAAAAVLPELLPRLEKTKLLAAALLAATAAVSKPLAAAAISPELPAAAAQLCAELLKGAGRASLAALSSGAGGAKEILVESLLTSVEDLPGTSAGSLAGAMAAAGCALQLCNAGRRPSSQNGEATASHGFGPPAAQRFARLLPLVAAQGTGSDAQRAALQGRLLSCSVLAAVSGSGEVAGPPADAWPGAVGTPEGCGQGVSAWAAWALAWALQPPLRAPLLSAGAGVLTFLSTRAAAEASRQVAGQPEVPLLPHGLELARAMARCRGAAACGDCHIRKGILEVAQLFPEKVVLKRLLAPRAADSAGWVQDGSEPAGEEQSWQIGE
ncbi:unnamed protein product, partial [Polarella glacialis]